jgi:hypothetical protein
MKMRILVLAAALALCWATASAEKIAKPGVTPIQAELMADLHAQLLNVGGSVFARVTVDCKGPGCVLRNGAILCVPPQCNVALPSGNASEAEHAAATISIREHH